MTQRRSPTGLPRTSPPNSPAVASSTNRNARGAIGAPGKTPPRSAGFAPARKPTSATALALPGFALVASSDPPPHQQATILHSTTNRQDALQIPLTKYVIAENDVGTNAGTSRRGGFALTQGFRRGSSLRWGKTRNRVSSGQATFQARSDLSCARPFDGQMMPSALQPAERIMP